MLGQHGSLGGPDSGKAGLGFASVPSDEKVYANGGAIAAGGALGMGGAAARINLDANGNVVPASKRPSKEETV